MIGLRARVQLTRELGAVALERRAEQRRVGGLDATRLELGAGHGQPLRLGFQRLVTLGFGFGFGSVVRVQVRVRVGVWCWVVGALCQGLLDLGDLAEIQGR